MVVSIPLITVVALILVLNSVAEHIFNWVFRIGARHELKEPILFATILLYLLRWAGVMQLLISIFKQQP